MLKDETHKVQSLLAGYCRDGKAVDLPGTTDGRLPQYRRLVFSVISGTMKQAYPIAAKHLGEEVWDELVHDFFANHPCQDPQVWRMPKELIDYVETSDYDKKLQLPHLPDLLKMEWLEIEVHAMPDQEVGIVTVIDDILNDPLCFNPHYRLEHFKYPVHKIHQLNPAENPGDYYLLIFREMTETARVRFVQLQPEYAAFLDTLIRNPGAPIVEVLEALKESTESPFHHIEKEDVRKLIGHLVDNYFVLGKAVF